MPLYTKFYDATQLTPFQWVTVTASDIVDDAAGGPVPATSTVVYTVTFSEPMDTGNLQPSRMNAQFWWLVGQVGSDPLWNAEGTQITVPLPLDKPAGLVVHPAAGHADGEQPV